ncbi:MAG TPA: GAF domain-containing protein, partial [Burkholderiaceae bacterium]
YRHKLLRLVGEYLGCSRVSLWRFSGEGEAMSLICRSSFEAAGLDLASGAQLNRKQFKAYFDRVLQLGAFVCPDVRGEPVLEGLREPYLDPQDVRALLDVSFGVNGRQYGVICCEQFGQPRAWTQTDVNTLLRVSRLVSLQVARVLSDSTGEPHYSAD